MRTKVVWTSVIAVALGVGSIISAGFGNSDLTLALGLTSLTAGFLSSRER
jgi:hypothetical protein